MSDIIRTRERRYRDDFEVEDDRGSSYGRSRGDDRGEGYTSVQRYTVKSGRVQDDDYDDRRPSRTLRVDKGGRSSHLEVDRVERVERIERPRSAFEPGYRDSYREPERERERETSRTLEVVRDRPREYDREHVRPWERALDRPWDRDRDLDVSVERRVEKRTTRDRDEPVEMERVTREVEYYDRPDPIPQPIVIRQRAPEPQQIYVESAPIVAPVILPRYKEYDNREIVPVPRQQEDYYYRREVVEGAPRGGEVAAYRDRRSRSDDYSDDDDRSEYYVRKERRVVRSRSGSRSRSPRHKLHLAEGALAGAGVAALVTNHNGSERRGRKALGGAALGALGAEVITRARSSFREKSRHRSRSRSSDRGDHHKLRTGLALAAGALVVAAAGKYVANRNTQKKEELARGRSRTRSRGRRDSSADEREVEKKLEKHTDPKHKAATAAKAGLAAAAVAGLVERARSKSRGRSKSRLRTGGAIAATGLAGAALANFYESRKAKQDEKELAEVERRRSRSRSTRRDRSLVYSDTGEDPELGMVQYGADPVYTEHTIHRETRTHHDRSPSRSRSRVRDIAAGAVATGAAAIGINKYQKRKERKEAERERRRAEEEASDSYYADSYDDGYSPSPPRASGGAYYPATNQFPPPPVPVAGQTTTTQQTTTVPAVDPRLDPHLQYPPYNPADYVGPQQPMDPYGYPVPHDGYPVPRDGNPTPHDGNPAHHDDAAGGHVSSTAPYAPSPPVPQSRNMYTTEEGRLTPPRTPSPSISPTTIPDDTETPHNKSVTFAPLSPTSTRTLERKRRNSDPSSDRPLSPSLHRKRHRNASRSPSPSSSSDVEELPDRFDRDGQLIPRHGHAHGDGREEMVERLAHDFSDVLDGRKSWKGLLRGFFEEQVGGSGGAGNSHGDSRRN